MINFRPISVDEWTSILGGALVDAEKKRRSRSGRQFIAKLNQQSRRIRDWDLGGTAPAAPSGWRLLK